jgi:hypothetical protein
VRNIGEVPEFIVHIVLAELLTPMEQSAKPPPVGADAQIEGITLAAAETVRPLRIREAISAILRLEM